MEFILKSIKHGDQYFHAPATDGFAYVWLDGRQICHGGGFRGSTVMCRGDHESLEAAARKWWRQHMALRRKAGGYI